MSLTTFLDNKDVRQKFSQEFVKPTFGVKKEILAPPITKRYSLVGTAFDYLMRFYLKYINKGAITNAWVAEEAVIKMNEIGRALSNRSVVGITNDTLDKSERTIREAKKVYSDYLRLGQVDNEVVTTVLRLGQLDTYFRSGIIDENFGVVYEEDIRDLLKLISIVPPNLFKAKELCILNPTFGEASELVGGADGDLIIDNMLIDIKTTTRLEFRQENLNQLVGYYVLSRIGGVDGSPAATKVENLAIYYSRFAELLSFPVSAVVVENRIPAFIQWFKNRADEF